MAKFSFSGLKEAFSDPRRRVKSVLILGGVLLTIPLLFSVGLSVVSNPSFCGNACHDQQPEYQSWIDSSHSQIPCYACHMPADNPIAMVLVKAKTGILGGLHEFVIGVDYPINKNSEVALEEIPKEVCERCHNLATRYISPRPIFSRKMEGKDTATKKKYHTKHLDKGITCTVCHNRVVHKEYAGEMGEEERRGDSRKQEIFDLFQKYKGVDEKGQKIPHQYEDFLEMKDGCLRCHTANPKERDEELFELFPKVKEASEKGEIPTACTTCHESSWEELPVGHGPNWRAEHGPIAKKDFSYCLECHDKGKEFSNSEGKKFCLNCHSEEAASKFE